MDWNEVGTWLKANAGSGAALVGSLLTGNVPGAVAAGVALVSSATGHATPVEALAALQADPATLVKLRALAFENEASIRGHVERMEAQRLADDQAAHEQTQLTVRAGDVADDRFVRWTRPGQSWVSLAAALAYVFARPEPAIEILAVLLTLPWAYAGLRQIGKGVEVFSARGKA